MIKYDPVSGELIHFPGPIEFGIGTSITQLAFRVPNMANNNLLHFILQVFPTCDYSGDPVETYNSASVSLFATIFDGTEWILFPSEGVGNPYYDKKLSVILRYVEPAIQYYIRYKWFIAGTDPSITPWYYTTYPALEVVTPITTPAT